MFTGLPYRTFRNQPKENLMSHALDQKVAVVTGGTSGIGLAIARRFAAEGASVYITGRRPQALEDALAQIDGDATGIQADASDAADLARLSTRCASAAAASTSSSPTRAAARSPRSARSPSSITTTPSTPT
jgi:NAD(P)-dependent dehydrogenase (short-subunit alcohol dehydrogenase family)